MIVLANDSHFAARLAAPTLRDHATRIQLVVISTKIRGRLGPALKILRRSSRRYGVFRVLVDVVTRINGFRGKGSVACLARKAGLPLLYTHDVNRCEALSASLPSDIGIAINFDQILKGSFLSRFRDGVLNHHPSRLPRDRGVSPQLWAFARGDGEIWATIYRMDAGLDTGPYFVQCPVTVRPEDTAFSLYERICSEGGSGSAGPCRPTSPGPCPRRRRSPRLRRART